MSTRARDVASTSPLSPWQVFGPLFHSLDASTAHDPFGFARADRLDPVRRSGTAAIASTANTPQTGSGELSHSLALRRQQIHQTENVRAARPLGPNPPVQAPPKSFSVYGKKFKHGQGDKLWLHLQARPGYAIEARQPCFSGRYDVAPHLGLHDGLDQAAQHNYPEGRVANLRAQGSGGDQFAGAND